MSGRFHSCAGVLTCHPSSVIPRVDLLENFFSKFILSFHPLDFHFCLMLRENQKVVKKFNFLSIREEFDSTFWGHESNDN